MNKKLINNIMRGVFTPIDYSKPRFETKVDVLKDLAKHKTEKSKDYIYNIDKNYVFPKYQLDSVRRSYQYKKFFPETYNKETGQMEGGYYPEEASYMRDEQGKIIRDEYGRIKEEPTFLEKVVPPAKEFLKEKEISEDEERQGEEEIQKMTDQFIEKVDITLKTKEKDLIDF